ncbi:MAG: hypothetical protein EOM31_10830 [Bacteroidia bacterium]|nr:hypothetical protein [Bacteroidia bacterium]
MLLKGLFPFNNLFNTYIMNHVFLVGRWLKHWCTIGRTTCLAWGVGTLSVCSIQISAHQQDSTFLKKPLWVSTVNDTVFSAVKSFHLMDGINGQIPGVEIYTSAVGVGGAPYVQIRGIHTLSGLKAPLYLVDGMPISTLISCWENLFGGAKRMGAGRTGDGVGFLNSDDIESISVIKGFTPELIYANEGANGVVLIKTKQGQQGKLQINYSNATQFNSPFVMPKFQRSYGFDEAYWTRWGEKLKSPSAYDPTDFFQTGHCLMNTLSFSGGYKMVQTYASVGMANGQGLIPNTVADRYNATLRQTFTLFKNRLKLDLSGMYMKVEEQNLLSDGSVDNPLTTLYLLPLTEKLDQIQISGHSIQDYEWYDEESQLYKERWFENRSEAGDNPYWLVNRRIYNNNKRRCMLSASLNFKVTDWLSVAGSSRYENNDLLMEKRHNGELVNQYWKLENDFTHASHQLAVYINKRIRDFSLIGAFNFIFSKEDYVSNLAVKGSLKLTDSGQLIIDHETHELSYLKRKGIHRKCASMVGVGYKDRYFIHLKNNWYDGYNNLINDSQVSSKAFSPAVGASLVLSDIFPIKSALLSDLRLGASYSNQHNLLNKARRFEDGGVNELEQRELTVNGQLFGGQLDVMLTAYHATSETNYFYNLDNPALSDTRGMTVLGLKNRGIEASLDFHQSFGDKFWNSRLNFSSGKTMVTKIDDGLSYIGYSFSSLPFPAGLLCYKRIESGERFGDLYVKDFQRDEQGYIKGDQSYLGRTDMVKVGNTMPKWRLNWMNGFSWKRFSASLLLSGRFGGECVSSTQLHMDVRGVSKVTGEARDRGGVQVSSGVIPAQDFYQLVARNGIGTPYVYSATNIRLAELSVSYDLPIQKWIRFVQGARVSLTGRNLLMLYCKAPFDPELSTDSAPSFLGIDRFMQPSLRTIGFAVNVKI